MLELLKDISPIEALEFGFYKIDSRAKERQAFMEAEMEDIKNGERHTCNAGSRNNQMRF